MSDDLKSLPKPEKKVVAKVLSEKGLSLREVGSILGLSDTTIFFYLRQETPEEYKQFKAVIEEQFRTKEDMVAAKALAHIETKIVTSRINDALEVYRTMRRLDKPGVIQQFNVGEDMEVKFA